MKNSIKYLKLMDSAHTLKIAKWGLSVAKTFFRL
jgi:hypothetical protein